MTEAIDSEQQSHLAKVAGRFRFGFLLLMLFCGWFSIAISQIALGLALIATVVAWFAGDRPVKTGLEIPALVLAGWALLMIPFSTDPHLSMVYYRRFYLLAALWLAASCASGESRRSHMLIALGVGALGVSLYWQITPLLRGDLLFSSRLTGIFNAMTTGALLMMGALLAFGFLLGARVARKWKFVAAFAALSLTIGVAQTFTRSAILGLGFGLVLMLLFTRPRLFGSLLAAFLVLALVFPGPLFGLLPDSLEKRFAPSQLVAGKSPQARFEMWRGGWTMIQAKPVTGFGDVGLTDLAPQYYGDGDTIYYGHLHSNAIQLAVIWGVPGFLLGSWFLLAPGWLLWKRWRILWRDRKNPGAMPWLTGWVLGAIGAWAGFNLAGLTEWYFGDAESMLMYAALVGGALGAMPVPETKAAKAEENHV